MLTTTTPTYLDAAWFAREAALLSQVAALHNDGVPMREACLRTWGGEEG